MTLPAPVPLTGVELIAAGNSCIDIFVPPHEPPPRGGIVLLPSLNAVPGGNGANTAIVASRLGVRTALAGVLGDDMLGRSLRDVLRSEAVGVDLLRLLPGRTTPATIVLNDASGERSFVHHPGTNADYALGEHALAAPCRVFHLAAPELLGSFWPHGAEDAARGLKAAGRVVSLDTFAVEGPKTQAEITREHRGILSHVDMVFPNEEESRLVTGKRELREMADYFHELGVRIVAIKRGERGAFVSWDGRAESVAAERIIAVDTCGAGDSFAAGFLAGHLRGLDPLGAARLGCALGALCVAHQGSTTGSADRMRLEAALSRAGGLFGLTRPAEAL